MAPTARDILQVFVVTRGLLNPAFEKSYHQGKCALAHGLRISTSDLLRLEHLKYSSAIAKIAIRQFTPEDLSFIGNQSLQCALYLRDDDLVEHYCDFAWRVVRHGPMSWSKLVGMIYYAAEICCSLLVEQEAAQCLNIFDAFVAALDTLIASDNFDWEELLLQGDLQELSFPTTTIPTMLPRVPRSYVPFQNMRDDYIDVYPTTTIPTARRYYATHWG